MCGSQEFDEFGDNASSNDILDGRVLFLGEELTEFGSSIVLLLDIIWVYISNQSDQVGMELQWRCTVSATLLGRMGIETPTLISSSTSISSSLSDMDALGMFMLRRFDKFSSRFCFLISTVCFCLRFLTWSEPKASLFLKVFFLSAAAVLSILSWKKKVIYTRKKGGGGGGKGVE